MSVWNGGLLSGGDSSLEARGSWLLPGDQHNRLQGTIDLDIAPVPIIYYGTLLVGF